MENNIVHLHVCGGGAYSIANKLKDHIFGNNKDFPSVKTYYIDTTDINMKSEFLRDSFFKINSLRSGSENEVSGSGGERSMHIESKVTGVREYVNQHKFLRAVQNEFHIVLFTCGGGSGSTIGPALIRELKANDITVVAFAIADSSTTMTASNSIGTIGMLDKMMNTMGKSLSMFYYDNGEAGDTAITANEKIVDDMILSDINILLAFLSTAKTDIDNADMHMFLDQTKYNAGNFNFSSGLIELLVVNDDYQVPPSLGENAVTMSRTLLSGNDDKVESNLNLSVVQRKIGRLTGDNINKIMKEYIPINLISIENSLNEKADILNDKVLAGKSNTKKRIEVADDLLEF